MLKESNAREILAENGLKTTTVRQAVLKTFLQGHAVWTADELTLELQKNFPISFDPSTVYRTLQTFADKHIIRTVVFEDGQIRFEIHHGHASHHHIVCRKCKHVSELHMDDCMVTPYHKTLHAKGFSKVEHRLEFYGICSDCS